MKQRSPTLEGFQTMFRLPSLGLAEIAWRWSFGLAAAVAFAFAVREYLSTLPVTAGEMLLLRTRQPVLMLQALARIFQGSAPRAVAAFLVLTLTLALAWIVLASLGRAASVKAVTAAELDTTYDVIVVAIRTSAVESAIAARCASPKYNGPRSVARSTAGRTRSSATSWITSPSPIPQIDGPSRCRSGGHGVRDQRGRFGRRRRVRGRRLSPHRGAAAVRRTGVGLRVRRLGPHHHCDSLHCRL